VILSLERSGQFDASTSMIPNNHKCAAMDTTTYHYTVRIETDGDKLTPEGYLINNELIQAYFDHRFGLAANKWDAISCELMAITSCRELAEQIEQSGIPVQCVECSITGSNGAKIDAKWTREEGN